MLNLDKTGIDKLLVQLEDKQFFGNRYRLYKEKAEPVLLGKGTFSYVYEMYDYKNSDKHYAAKVIGVEGKDLSEEKILEAMKMQSFLSDQSKNIIRVIAIWIAKVILDEHGDVLDIIRYDQMEYESAEGIAIKIILMERSESIISKDKYGNVKLLRDELKTQEEILKFAKEIGEALLVIHNNGYLHRDIKLENIFWDEESRQYKLGDFGIAKYIGDGDAETKAFTNGYGAPEIERQLQFSYNTPADIYSFGITLFLLLNDLKFPASSGYYVNSIQYSKDFSVPAPCNAPSDMARIIRKMCSYRAENRYQMVKEIITDLNQIDQRKKDQESKEYDDLETVTYREYVDTQKETNIEENNEKNDTYKEKAWWEKEEYELNREDQKKRNQAYEKMYVRSSFWRMIAIAVLTVCLLNLFPSKINNIHDWQFWIFPIILLVDSISQSIKEFYMEFNIVVIAFTIYSMYTLGVEVSQIVTILIVILGTPTITMGYSIGFGIWLIQMLTGNTARIKFLHIKDLGWLILLLFIGIIQEYMILRAEYEKEIILRFILWVKIIGYLSYVMVIGGIILWALDRMKIMSIPEIIRQVHLMRIGIGIFIIQIITLQKEGILDKENIGEDK